MLIASQTLAQLQKSGSVVKAAALALQKDLQTHSQALMEQMALRPFGPETDRAYQQMRHVARLVHEVNSMEQQLKAIYLDASRTVQAEVSVLPSLPSLARRRRLEPSSAAVSHEPVEDAKLVTLGSHKRKVRKQDTAGGDLPHVVEPQLANSERLLQALKKILGNQTKAVAHLEMARASGLPPGSIGASIRKLVAAKKLAVESTGAFKLI